MTLFNDTFLNRYRPEVGIAAVEILARGGCRVGVARSACCGRPLISQGLLGDAQSHASQLVAGLFPIVSGGEKIVFCEPICLSAVKGDAPSLLRGEEQKRAQLVAEACLLFEEFAATLELALRPGPTRILLHGHCHQKAMGLLPATMSLLARIPSAQVTDLDAGCCGMAGSFGYAREHYEISRSIAGRRLLPAAQAMKPGEVLVAPGTSCRHQVAELAGVAAVHPATLVHSLM